MKIYSKDICHRTIMFLLLIVFFLLSTTSYSQRPSPILNFSGKHIHLYKVFDYIHGQTGYKYSCNDPILNNIVDIELKNVSLDEFLDKGLATYRLQCYLNKSDSTILLKRIEDTPAPEETFPWVQGYVMGEQKEFLQGVAVEIKDSPKGTHTDTNGAFHLKDVPVNALIIFSGVNVQTQERAAEGHSTMNIYMKTLVQPLKDVKVTYRVNNGYQKIVRERTTGSYDQIDRHLLDRSDGMYLPDRMENLLPGILKNHGGQAADGSSQAGPMIIRGLSTFYANASPLIIVDNFVYDGDINNINPNDIESIQILKDAAAASIWGVRAGNGVIIISTKRGNSRHLQVTVNSSISFQKRPDVFNRHTISSGDYIDLEKDLYSRHYYDANFSNSLNFAPVTPVVSLLHDADLGVISRPDANARIEALKKYDVRNDLQKYLYRNSVIQQHQIQLSGRTSRADYFLSTGWDLNPATLSGSQYTRMSLRGISNYSPNKHVEVSAGISYTKGIQENGNNPGYNYLSPHGGKAFYPYAQLADAQGRPLTVYTDYNQDYLQQAAARGLSDWTYAPLTDLSEEKNKVKTQDYLLNLGVRYKIIPSLAVEFKYQFERQTISQNDNHTAASYFSRDLTNTYAQPGQGANQFTYPIPLGGITDRSLQDLQAQQGRVQINYTNYVREKHDLSLIGGIEVRSVVTRESSSRQYGVGDPAASFTINDTSLYPSYLTGDQNVIPTSPSPVVKTEHILSSYLKGSCTFRHLYTFSASARADEANLFGMQTNQKVSPLWSAGGTWHVNQENFFHSNRFSLLNLRASYGSSGNMSGLATAYTTALYNPDGIIGTGYATASVQNPANNRIKWELVKMTNVGVDFVTKDHIYSGTVEYYVKNSSDLIALEAIDPTRGFVQNPGGPSIYYGNTASMKGKGVDIELTTDNLAGRLRWTTNFIFTYSSSKVTRYSLPQGAGNTYLSQNAINPILGKPLYSIFSYKWLGLDPHTGNPIGAYNGKPSTSYDSIYSTHLDSMVYNGPAQPTVSGAVRNTVSLGRFSVSFNISYKFGYYFRKTALSYGDLLTKWNGSSSYAERWQKPGDEKRTNVPSIDYTNNPSKDFFYANSSVQVDRADNIRFEDVNISYETNNFRWGKLHFQHLRLFTYCSNLFLIWKANKDGIDPYYVNVPADGKRYSVGLSITF
ncbi:MAG TPA: SusC/RagA family TonB-linked outer membrane protein [Puia sp.]|nr:SusC/RagA family TonB-linked outer membrane protein [Puia sp.]